MSHVDSKEPGVGHGSSCGADLKETKYDHQKFCPVHYLNLTVEPIFNRRHATRSRLNVRSQRSCGMGKSKEGKTVEEHEVRRNPENGPP